MKKNEIITCPTPKQVESEHILEWQSEAQEYFNNTILPLLSTALHEPTKIPGELRYGAYTGDALEKAGWKLKWDNTSSYSKDWCWTIHKRDRSLNSIVHRYLSTRTVVPAPVTGFIAFCLIWTSITVWVSCPHSFNFLYYLACVFGLIGSILSLVSFIITCQDG